MKTRSCTPWTLGVLVACCAATSCDGQKLKCGAGTTKNDNHECVPTGSPDFNVIVGDFDLGDFEFTQVDVPEQMQVGTPDLNRTYTIRNKGDSAREYVFIQYGVAPVDAVVDELQERLDAGDPDLEAEATYLGGTIIEDLAAGEARTISYDLAVPNTVADGLYGFFFAVDALPMTYNAATGQYEIDYLSERAAELAAQEPPLVNAPAKYAPATIIIGVPTEPNLRVLTASLDNASFLLDASERQQEPLFTLSARMSSMALDLTEEVNATFELQLPGHVIDEPGADLGADWFLENGYELEDYNEAAEQNRTTSYLYDADRRFPLSIRTTDGLVASRSYGETCRTESVVNEETQEAEEVEKCAVVFNDGGRDDVYELYLAPSALRLLGQTTALLDLNPDLDDNGEIVGSLVMTVATEQAEYQDNLADNAKDLDVVFMAPALDRNATTDDTDNAGVEVSPNSFGDDGPYPYTQMDRTESKTFGNDWFGAGYKFDNESSYDKFADQPYKQNQSGDNSLKATVIQQEVTILAADGEVDYGADRSIGNWGANADVTVFGYTLYSVELGASFCQTSDSITYCNLFETDFSAPPTKGSPKKAPRVAKREVVSEYQYFFTIGPVPMLVQASAAVSAGLKVVAALVFDNREPERPQYGVQFAAGPTAAVQVGVFGGVSLAVVRGGIEGTLTIVEVELLPYLRPTIGAKFDDSQSCYKYSQTTLGFAGPIRVAGPNGRIEIVFYAGLCVWGVCWETKVFGLTLASIATYEYSYDLWNLEPKWSKQPGSEGMCADAVPPAGEPYVWNSPTGCDGEYCNWTSGNRVGVSYWEGSHWLVLTNYKKRVYSTGCVRIRVLGTTEKRYDRVVLYDHNGLPTNFEWDSYGNYSVGWSGSINETLYVCQANPVTVTLETDTSVTRSGVTVTFEDDLPGSAGGIYKEDP